MRQPQRRSMYLVAILVDLMLASGLSCGSSTEGSSSSPEAGSDGTRADARDGTRADAGGRDASKPDTGVDGGVSPGATAFCQAEYAAVDKCKLLSAACLAAIGGEAGLQMYIDDCAAAWSEYGGNAYLQALADCFGTSTSCCVLDPSGACAEAGIVEAEGLAACALRKLGSAVPGPLDQDLRADFCDTCPDKGSALHACAGFFDLAEAGLDASSFDAGSLAVYLDAGLGLGSFALTYSDPIVQAIDTSCTNSALADFDAGLPPIDAASSFPVCYARFALCAESVAQAYTTAHPPMVGDVEMLASQCRPEAGATGEAGGFH